MTHTKRRECVNPCGDGCDGDHYDKQLREVAEQYCAENQLDEHSAYLATDALYTGAAYQAPLSERQGIERVLKLLRSGDAAGVYQMELVNSPYQWADYIESELAKEKP